MSWQPPSVHTLDLNPERAALALLAATLTVARNTLLAAHTLPLTQTTDPCTTPPTLLAEVVLAHLDALAGSLERYLAVSQHDPSDDDDFDF